MRKTLDNLYSDNIYLAKKLKDQKIILHTQKGGINEDVIVSEKDKLDNLSSSIE